MTNYSFWEDLRKQLPKTHNEETQPIPVMPAGGLAIDFDTAELDPLDVELDAMQDFGKRLEQENDQPKVNGDDDGQ